VIESAKQSATRISLIIGHCCRDPLGKMCDQ
jgi:hypothetical protein